jgi:hypothetical protein
MLVDYTTVLDGPSVSVEGPTQQGVESVVEVTPASSVTSDGSSDPPLRLRLLRALHVVARTATGVVIVSRLVLKCYELRTRQHKNRLMVNALCPSKHYFP